MYSQNETAQPRCFQNRIIMFCLPISTFMYVHICERFRYLGSVCLSCYCAIIGGATIFPRSLKGTVSRDFRLLAFFMDQFPPSIRVYHYGHFKFFRKFAEIFAAQGTPPVSTTPVANGKNLQAEKF